MIDFEEEKPKKKLDFQLDFQPDEAPKGPSLMDKAIGVGETALSFGSGLAAQIPAGVGAALSAANDFTAGRDVQFKQPFEGITHALTYEPRTEVGKDYAEELGQSGFMQSLNALGGVAHTMPPVRTAPSIRSMVPKETPIPGSKLDALKTQKPPEAVKPAEGLGFEPELDLFSPDQKQLGRSPYDDVGGKWQVDENGIPIKQRLSEDLQRTQEDAIGQARLFDEVRQTIEDPYAELKTKIDAFAALDELKKQQEITKRNEIDGAYRQYDEQKKQAIAEEAQARRDEVLMKIQEELSVERESKGQQRKDNQRRVPRSQQGAIDVSVMDPSYDRVKRNEDGYIYRLRGGPEPTVYAIDTSGPKPEVIAHARFGRDKYYRPTSAEDNLQPKWVQTIPEHQKKGIAQNMYKFVAEQGHDIIPDDVQTPYGKKLWASLERQGVAKSVDFESFPAKVYGDPQKRTTKIPQSQRGGIDLKALRDGIRELAKKAQPDNVTTRYENFATGKERAAQDLPGGVGNWIPNDPTSADIITAAKSEGDSNIRFDSAQSGATLTAIKHDSSLIRGIGRLFQNAQKRSELSIRQEVYPVEHVFKKLNPKELAENAELLKSEMFDGKVFSIEDLQQVGYSAKQIEAYVKLRDLFEKAYQRQAQALEAQGKKVPTKKEAYLSSRWVGDWSAPVYDAKGKLVWYIRETTKAGVQRALKHLEKNGVEFDKTKSKIAFEGGKQGRRTSEVNDAYLTMLSILDPGDVFAREGLKAIMEDHMANEGFNTLGQKKHFLEKSNVRGFLGDKPWKSEKANTYDLFRSQFDYIKNAYNWTELQNAVKTSKEVLSDPEIVANQPNNVRYAQSYAKNKLGFGEEPFVKALEDFVAKTTGTSRGSFYNVVDSAKSFFILSKLGFNLGFMGANYIQPLWTSAWHADLSAQGFKHNPFGSFVKAGMDGHAGYLRHKFGAELPMTEVGEYALKYAEDNGIVSRDMFDETANLGRHPIVENAEQIASTSIKEVEHLARLNAFMGFVHHLEQSGVYTDATKLFQHAEELTNAAMVDYRTGEGPMAFDKMGVTGSSLKTLQTFKFNYYNQLHYFYKQAKEGHPQGLLTFLALQGVIGGALSLPFLQAADDTWDTIKGMLPDSAHMHVKDFGIKQWLIQNLPDWAAFGGASKLTGANLSSRFDTGNLVDFSLDGMFPFISDIINQGSAIASAAVNPNQTTLAQAAYAVAPPGPAQGLVETSMEAFKDGPRTKEGNQPYLNPRKLQQQDASFVRTPEQERMRVLGLTELGESKYKELRYRQNKNEQESEKRRNELATKWFDSIVRQDDKDMEKYMYRYVQYGGDPQTLINRLDDDMLRRRLPQETIDAMKAKSFSAVMKAKRIKEVLNGFNK